MSMIHEPYQYSALGDSLTVGIGSDLFHPGFVWRYAEDCESALGRPVYFDTIAKSGATSGEILVATYVPAVVDSIRSSEIITITAGANDLIDAAERYLIVQNTEDLFKALETATTNINKLIDQIHEIHNPGKNRYMIRMLNLYNPFPQIPGADQWIERFNQALLALSSHQHIRVADVHSPFAGRQEELLVPGGIHPNVKGYKVIAEQLNQLGYAPLV